MKQFFYKNRVLLLAIAALLIPVAVIEWQALHHTNGVFTYPLDDTFIHMAVAGNVADHHVWGINSYEFGSASSSILYTLLLSILFHLPGPHILIPFLINCIAACLLLAAISRWMKKEGISDMGQAAIFLAIIFFTPLPILVISGMEHSLQCLFTFLFIFEFAGWLEGRVSAGDGSVAKGKWALPWTIYVYGMLICMIRYEGMFLVACVCLVLLCYRRLVMAIGLGLIAVLPLVLFGAYSISKGSYFLPNSVLLKSDNFHASLGGILEFIGNILIQKLTVIKQVTKSTEGPRPGISALVTQRLLILLPLAFLVFRKQFRDKKSYGFILVILTACTLLHLAFASTGWLYRYEAYLMLNAIVILGVLLYRYGRELMPQKTWAGCAMVVTLLFALLFPALLRSMAAYTKTAQACVNIYQQQYQMGLFLHKYYDKDAVAANDVGAISYFSHGNNMDLWGLGNIDIAKSRKGNYWTAGFMDSLCRKRNVRIAIVFDSWFSDSLLHRWKKVATWQIPDNVICGDDTVSFYAVAEGEEPLLRKDLEDFSAELPKDVRVKYFN